MTIIRRIVSGLHGLFTRQRDDRDLDDELHAYLEAAVDRKTKDGMARDEAVRAARAEMGSMAAIKDDTRDAGWEFVAESICRDVRCAVRTLRRAPGFATVAVVTLALGVGATTAIFSVVDAVVLRALPFDEHDRLVAVGTSRPSSFAVPIVTVPSQPGPGISTISNQDYLDCRDRQRVFTGLSAFLVANVALQGAGGEPEEVRALRTTPELFEILRVQPVLGRVLVPDDEKPGRNRVAVISHGLWQRRFGGMADVVGRTIRLDDVGYEIAGVAPSGFTYPLGSDRPAEIWVPLVIPAAERVRIPGRYGASLRAVARLKSGVSLEQARVHMDGIARGLETEYPEWNKDRRAAVLPHADSLDAMIRSGEASTCRARGESSASSATCARADSKRTLPRRPICRLRRVRCPRRPAVRNS